MQAPANKPPWISGFRNIGQHLQTGFGGLWLRRARIGAPSVTLSHRLVRTGLACSAKVAKHFQALGRTEGPGNAPLL
jgi:hypothetical protein